MATCVREPLFGRERRWHTEDWTASDDRVRGGRSHSYLKIADEAATFCGHLDIETLGGAGFASQRTTGDDRHWDLSAYDAIELLVDTSKSDTKRYTFILKDEILPPDPGTGREQSTTSWEYDFFVEQKANPQDENCTTSIIIPWAELRPTYRGREKDPGHTILLSNIRRISIMMRSFFGDQKGDFSLCILAIMAVKVKGLSDPPSAGNVSDSSVHDSIIDRKLAKYDDPVKAEGQSIWTRLMSLCNKL